MNWLAITNCLLLSASLVAGPVIWKAEARNALEQPSQVMQAISKPQTARWNSYSGAQSIADYLF